MHLAKPIFQTNQSITVRIQLAGRLAKNWSGWLEAFSISYSDPYGENPLTFLTGSVPDQAALRGLLNKIWNMNLTVVSVECFARMKQDLPASASDATEGKLN